MALVLLTHLKSLVPIHLNDSPFLFLKATTYYLSLITDIMAADAVSAPFDRLPVEILLDIALRVPDISSLYALDKASEKFALMFNVYGSHILERMIDTAGLGAHPHQVREIIRLTIYVRTTCLNSNPPKSPAILDVFMSQLFEKTSGSAAYTPIRPDTMPSLLREVLAIAATIDKLASLCLATLMRRCLALRPSHPINTSRPKPGEFMGPQPEYFARPGYTYTPHSSGPPSWLERQRVLRAFWTVQLYLELCCGVADGRIVFAMDDEEALRDPLEAIRMEGLRDARPLVSCERAVNTVLSWLCGELGWSLPECKVEDLEKKRHIVPVHLPRPPTQGAEWAFDWDNEGMGCFPGCEDDFVFRYDKLHDSSLSEAPGENFLDISMWHLQRFSPVFNIAKSPIFDKLA